MQRVKTFEDFLAELEAPRPENHEEEIQKIANKRSGNAPFDGNQAFSWNQRIGLERQEKRLQKEKEERLDAEVPPMQSHRIFRKFGGVQALARIMAELGIKRGVTCFYKWNYRGGHIPAHAWKDIFKAAKYAGVMITSEDLDPRENFLNKQYLLAFPKREPKWNKVKK